MHTQFELAIFEEPDCLAHYAAYGDWLHERGDPHGDFIQVQLALEDETRSAAERQELRAREEELLRRHEDEWLGPLACLKRSPRPGTPSDCSYRFARGFLHSLTIPNLNLERGRALRDAASARFLRHLVIEGEDGEGRDAPGDDLPEDRATRWYPFLGLYPLIRSPMTFPCLRSFRLGPEPEAASDDSLGWSDCWTYCYEIVTLVERMPRLEELHLLCKRYDVERLFASGTLSRLRVLRIYHLGVRGPTGHDRVPYAYPLDVLAGNPTFAGLTHLLLHPHHEEDVENLPSFLPLDQIRAVLNSPHLRDLTHLQLRLSDAGDRACQALVESGALKRLRWLDLRHGCVRDDGARLLADCPDLPHLEHLDLSRNALSEVGISLLRATGVNVRADAQYTDEELADHQYLREGDCE